MNRISYALKQAWHYRQALQTINRDKQFQVKQVDELDCQALYARGIRALILDFDGVLAPHGNVMPLPSLMPWLNSCVAQFGAGRVLILSNNPLPERIHYFNEQCPGIEFVRAARKKPYPDGILAISQKLDLPPSALLMVDDRLLTGVLAAVIAHCQVAYVTQPLIAWYQRPVTEGFFVLLRKIERLIH